MSGPRSSWGSGRRGGEDLWLRCRLGAARLPTSARELEVDHAPGRVAPRLWGTAGADGYTATSRCETAVQAIPSTSVGRRKRTEPRRRGSTGIAARAGARARRGESPIGVVLKALFVDDSTSSPTGVIAQPPRSRQWWRRQGRDQRDHHRGGPFQTTFGLSARIASPRRMDAARSCDPCSRRLLCGPVDGSSRMSTRPRTARPSRSAGRASAAPPTRSSRRLDGPWPWLRAAIDEADLMVIHGDGAMVGEGIISTDRPLPRPDLARERLEHTRHPNQSQRRLRPAEAAADGRARSIRCFRCRLPRTRPRPPDGGTWEVGASQPTARSGSHPPIEPRGRSSPDDPPTSTSGRTRRRSTRQPPTSASAAPPP